MSTITTFMPLKVRLNITDELNIKVNEVAKQKNISFNNAIRVMLSEYGVVYKAVQVHKKLSKQQQPLHSKSPDDRPTCEVCGQLASLILPIEHAGKEVYACEKCMKQLTVRHT